MPQTAAATTSVPQRQEIARPSSNVVEFSAARYYWTKFDHDLFDQMHRCSGSEWKVICVIQRFTKGCGVDQVQMTIGKVAAFAGLDEKTARRAIAGAEKKDLLRSVDRPGKPATYSPLPLPKMPDLPLPKMPGVAGKDMDMTGIDREKEDKDKKLASYPPDEKPPAPTEAEVQELADGLEQVAKARTRIRQARPNAATCVRFLRHARSVHPDATVDAVVDWVLYFVMDNKGFKSWGGPLKEFRLGYSPRVPVASEQPCPKCFTYGKTDGRCTYCSSTELAS